MEHGIKGGEAWPNEKVRKKLSQQEKLGEQDESDTAKMASKANLH